MKQINQQSDFLFYHSNFVWFHRAFVFFFVNLILAFSAIGLFAQTSVTGSSTAANLDAARQTPVSGQQPETTPAASLPAAETLIHLGDALEVDVLGSLEYDWRGKADDEGNLTSLPYPDLTIATLCRTENEIAADITAAYRKFMRDPQIVVRVLDRSARQPAVLFGAVRTQQRFRIQRPVRLSELVVLSGGITDSASGTVKIMRPARHSCAAHNQSQNQTDYQTIKLSDLMSGRAASNPFIRTGDVVTIEEAAPVYVIGGVAAPQRILFRDGLSLTRAIASAGGLSRGVDAAKITIFRRQDNQAQNEIIEADWEQVKRQKTADIVLQPFDVVEVSQAGRNANRRPPIVNSADLTPTAVDKLPLRVIS